MAGKEEMGGWGHEDRLLSSVVPSVQGTLLSSLLSALLLEIVAKDNLPLIFPRKFQDLAVLTIIIYFWKFQSFSVYSFLVFNIKMDSSSLDGRSFPVTLWGFLLILLKVGLCFVLFFPLSGWLFSHWHGLCVFSCFASPQGVCHPTICLSVFSYIFVFPPLASLLHYTHCSCFLHAKYLLHTLCYFTFSLQITSACLVIFFSIFNSKDIHISLYILNYLWCSQFGNILNPSNIKPKAEKGLGEITKANSAENEKYLNIWSAETALVKVALVNRLYSLNLILSPPSKFLKAMEKRSAQMKSVFSIPLG